MTIDELAAHFSNPTRRGKRYLADCPLHPAKPGTLTFRSEFGSIELECKQGCPDHEIVRAAGLTTADLFDDDDDSFTGDYAPDLLSEPGILAPLLPEEGCQRSLAGWWEVTGQSSDRNSPEEDAPLWRTNVFDTMAATEWLTTSSARPTPSRLFGPFWLEGEISILFADTGKGKSVLAVQIAEALASGTAITPFEPEVPAQKVLYFDFELSAKMFEARYSIAPEVEGGPTTGHYPFSPNFLRAQLSGDPGDGGWDTYGEYLTFSFDQILRECGARLVIIDNITNLGTSNKERSGGALKVMQVLHQFRHEFGLSFLVLAHTPKRRFNRGLTVNDLQGSKMLSNFADNVFAIGDSCLGPDVRYLKHIKPRNSPLIHGASNVCAYRIEKESNFLQFRFTGYSHEREHLELLSIKDEIGRRMLILRVKELAELGMSIRQIARELGISKSTVAKFLKL